MHALPYLPNKNWIATTIKHAKEIRTQEFMSHMSSLIGNTLIPSLRATIN